MKLKVEIEQQGQEKREVNVSPLAFIGWEKQSGRRMSDLAKGGLGMLDLAQLTMQQLKLEGVDVGESVEAWLATVDDLTPVSDDPKALAEVAIDAPSLS